MRRPLSARHIARPLLWGFLALVTLALVRLPPLAAQSETTWKEDWAIERGFSITTDVAGVQYPTSLTFVPNPGSNPKDPLYFVTELLGTIKVVTNDRSVYTFADKLLGQDDKPDINVSTNGLTGLCLDPPRGYVYALFAIRTTGSAFTNHIVRFTTAPYTFSTAAQAQQVIAPVIESYEATSGHQIDSCMMLDDLLYVAVGEGGKRAGSQDISLPFGKILRMTLDGEPAPGNPFYTDGSSSDIRNYVWAYGLRNPYAFEGFDGRIFTFDNGENTDRLLALTPGENYHWDGTDWSIGANALTVVSPSLGPAQMEYVPADGTGFPASHTQTLYVASAAGEQSKTPGIVALPVDFASEYVTDIPRFFVQYRGTSYQYVVGLALGPDALYFTALMPDAAGENYVFKINYDPDNAHPYVVGEDSSGRGLINLKGCLNCHTLDKVGGATGPILDRDALVASVQARLASSEYRALVAQLDASTEEPYVSYRGARQEVLAASGDSQLRTWIQYHLLEPKFDNPNAQMPNLGLTPVETSRITAYLLGGDSERNAFQEFAARVIPNLRYVHVALFFALGVGVGAGLVALLMLVKGRRSRRKARGDTA